MQNGASRVKKRAGGSFLRIGRLTKTGLEWKAVWFGFIASLGVWLAAAALALFSLYFRGSGTYWLGVYAYLSGIAGVFCGGLLAGKSVARRGWLNGLCIGLLLGFLGIIVNLEVFPYYYTWAGMGRQVLIWSLWGLCGGQVGFSLKPLLKKEKNRMM